MHTKEFRVLNPRLDVNFKAIFTQNSKDSRFALKSFLTAAIGRKIKKVTVIENENPKQFDLQRGISYDINCVFEDDTCAQIEMQGFEKAYDYGKRAEYYAARLVSSAVSVGDDWDSVPLVYQISVLNFIYDDSNDNPIHQYTMIDKKDGAKLAGILNVIFMELPKIPEINNSEDVKNLPTLVKWCKFLQIADDREKQDLIDALIKSEEGIMKAESTLKGISMDRWRWIIQGQIEGIERDRISEINARKREEEKRRIEDEKRAKEDAIRAKEDARRAQREKELSQREVEIADREEKIAEAKNKLTATENKLTETEGKLNESRRKLTATESKLTFTENKLVETENKLTASAAKLLALGLTPEQVSEALSIPLEDLDNLRVSAET